MSKEINVKNVHKHKTKSLKSKLKEYDNLKNLVKSLLKRNFCYISLLYGGFYDVHSLAIKYYIPLLNHDDNDCYICKKDENDSNLSFFSKLSNLFSDKDRNDTKNKLDKSDKNVGQLTSLTPITKRKASNAEFKHPKIEVC